MLAGTGSVHEAASTLTLTPEHVRLYCEIASTGPPPATPTACPSPRPGPMSSARPGSGTFSEHQNLPMTGIAALAGCATATIRRLLQIDGVPQRPAYRRPPPESGITREWLHREYVVKLRSIDTIARERGVSAPTSRAWPETGACPSAGTAITLEVALRDAAARLRA